MQNLNLILKWDRLQQHCAPEQDKAADVMSSVIMNNLFIFVNK